MLLHVSPVWSSLRGTVSVQGQAVVLASTTLRRQSCCRSEVLTSSRIADLVDTSSGEAHHGGFPGIFPPLLGGPLSEDRGGVQSVRVPIVSILWIPLQGKPSWWPPRYRYLFRGSHHGGLPGIFMWAPLKAHWDGGSHSLQESPHGGPLGVSSHSQWSQWDCA